MKNKIFILVLCLASLRTIAQSGAAVQSPSVTPSDAPTRSDTSALSDALATVQSRAGTWQQLVLQEKLFVHVDKPFYLAGEILWCSLYCVDGLTHRPLGISKIAYVEVLDPDNRPVLQGKIALDNGAGEGSFAIPPSVNSGIYRLRAYTNWMRNFGPETFFDQPITIVNTIKGIDTAAVTRPDTTRPYSLNFFPEGGDLIAGLSSEVAFEAVNDRDQGIDAEGAILRTIGLGAAQDTVVTFHPQKAGLGVFRFTPLPGQTYKAILYCPDGITRSWPLPAVLQQGYTLHLHDDGRNLTLSAHASPGLDLQNTRLFIHTGTESAFSGQTPTVTGDSILFIVPRSRLQDGNTRFTLFDAAGRPRAERQFFIPPHDRLHFTVTTDQPAYGTRQKVRLEISLDDASTTHATDTSTMQATDTSTMQATDTSTTHATGPTGARPIDPTKTRVSIAVYRLDSLQGYPVTDILRYLWQSSEWTGSIPSSAGFDDPTLSDLYSLTHGWSRFRWTDVLSHPYGPRLFPPEIRGQIITGRLSDPHTGAPAKEVITFLSAPGTNFQFATAVTDTGGRFQFDVKDFYGQDGLVISADNPYKIEAFSPFSEQYAGQPLPVFRLTRQQLHLLTGYNIGLQVENIFSGDSLRRFSLPRMDTTTFFGHPDYTYLLDNYTRFTTIEEVLREYVREINVTRQNGHLHLVMLNEANRTMFRDANTLVLLDGINVPADRIFKYDALKVRKLEIIPREYILGPAHFSGIASFTTYKGDFEGLELDSSSLQIDYEGLQVHRQFYSPAYPTARQMQSRLPDLRNVLYWDPNIRIATTPSPSSPARPIEFYTSDLPGDYLIVIEGLAPDGRAGITYRQFTVHAAP